MKLLQLTGPEINCLEWYLNNECNATINYKCGY